MVRDFKQKHLKELAPFQVSFEARTRHGGNPSLGHRKTARPFTAKAPTHVVLASKRARAEWCFLKRRHHSKIQSMIYTYASRFKIQVYRATTLADQIHLLVKTHDRKNLADFLRVLAGRVAVVVSGAKRGVKKIGKFWDYLCWSRLVNWGRDFFQVRRLLVESQHRIPTKTAARRADSSKSFFFFDEWGESS